MPDLLIKLLLVGAGGGAGSIARFGLNLLARAIVGERFPLGTLMANLLGCAAAGVIGHVLIERQSMPENTRLLLLTGFLGGLTTFSAFGLETVAAFRAGDARLAALNMVFNVGGSLIAVWAGWSAARAIAGAPAATL